MSDRQVPRVGDQQVPRAGEQRVQQVGEQRVPQVGDRQVPLVVERALRCYPARWRRRHGDDAAELAALLISDGAWTGSIALSYLLGAAREWLTPLPGQRLSTAACALLIGVSCLAASAVLVAAPARAALTPARVHGAGQSAVRGPARCRLGPAGPAPIASRAVGELPMIIWEAERVRSC
jgi:hypothetical protein